MSILGIGLPVYNDENGIKIAIESVLQQTFFDFELHVFDNCSTDNTCKVVEDFIKRDSRIKLHKNSVNIGMAANFNKCLNVKNINNYKYVSIKSSNDYIKPTYYESCIKYLEKHNDCSLCYTEGTNTINGIQEMPSYDEDDVYVRLSEIVNTQGCGNMNYGVIPANIIDKLVPIKNIQGFDHIFFFNCAMFGKLHKIEKVLYDREPPINRTDKAYKKACYSSISGKVIYEIPHFVDLIYGYIELINNCYLNELDKNKIIELVINTSLKVRGSLIKEQCKKLKKTIATSNITDEYDLMSLKMKLQVLNYYFFKCNTSTNNSISSFFANMFKSILQNKIHKI